MEKWENAVLHRCSRHWHLEKKLLWPSAGTLGSKSWMIKVDANTYYYKYMLK
jgi:hypothetical protein